MNIRHDILLTLPVLIPLATAALALIEVKRRRIEKLIGLAGSGALLIASILLFLTVRREGVIAVSLGGWPAPYGITLVADLFAAIMVLMAGLMGFLVAIYALYDIDARRVSFGFYPLYHILLMGVCGAFLTGDLFNLFVFFEIMLMSSFVLLVLGGERPQAEGALKYVTLNLIASMMFLAGIGILYGKAGVLNMADLSIKLADFDQPHLITAFSLLFLGSFGIKAGLFPLFFWLPASYHTPPVAITTLFSALLTKVGVYAIIRMFTLVFTQEPDFSRNFLAVIAILTMITGVLGAVAQYDFRRLLSFHIISQIGYLIMGLAIGTKLALAGAVYFMVHVIFAKSMLFLVSGVANRHRATFDLKRLGGFYQSRPIFSGLFLVGALSLAGIPPLSGFFAKFALVRAGLEAQAWWLVAAALGVSVLTLYSMVKIWTEAFWKKTPADGAQEDAHIPMRDYVTMHGPILVLGACILAMGLAAEPIFQIALEAADQLLNPEAYLDAVLEHRNGPAAD